MPGKEKKILIVAGEASGDLHGSRVAEALKALDPGLKIYGVGREKMGRAGAELIVDSSAMAVVGITEVLGHLKTLARAFWKLKRFIQKEGLTCLILIDFPDFNILLSGVAKRAQVPVLYYISPQVWAWRPGRVGKIARRVEKMAVIFPFEVPIYRQAGVEVEFVGHPLLDSMGDAAGESLPFDPAWKGEPLIALLPGSRSKEIHLLLPEMMGAAEEIAARMPGAKFILALAPGFRPDDLKPMVASRRVGVTLVEGKTYGVLRAADLAIVASGTATLETAILGKPMVIVYRVSPLSYRVGKALVKVPWVGLVNIVAGRDLVPELLQGEARGERIAAEAMRILEDGAYRSGMLAGLAEVRQKLGAPGAARRVAASALEMMNKPRS